MDEIIKGLLINPETTSATVSALFVQYKPLVYGILKELFGCFKDLVDNDDYFNLYATYYEKMIKALTDHGFSRNEAMKIIIKENKDTREVFRRYSGVNASVKV